MIHYDSFESFQPMKNVKTLLNSWAVQKQLGGARFGPWDLFGMQNIFIHEGRAQNTQCCLCQGPGNSQTPQ